MNYEDTLLRAYKEKIEVLELSMEVPVEKYADAVLKYFNNMREEKAILKIQNYYGSNKITLHINFTHYLQCDSEEERAESIEHLKDWFRGGLDIADKDIEVNFYEGYIFNVSEFDNKCIKSFDGNKWIMNYLILEDY